VKEPSAATKLSGIFSFIESFLCILSDGIIVTDDQLMTVDELIDTMDLSAADR